MKTEFNLVKYIYGRLYAGTFEGSTVVLESKKVYSWINVLIWLKKNSYILSYRIIRQGDKAKIYYVFNHQNKMYEYYLKGIERNINIYSLNKIPTGEIIGNKKVDDFEQERLDKFQRPIERLDKEDHVRCRMTMEEIYAA